MKKQCDDCSESHPRHRLSLMSGGLVMNLWPGQIMSVLVAAQRRKKKKTSLTSHQLNAMCYVAADFLLLI